MKILTAVVVQIIGLAVLRNEPQLGGMHVVLPRVGSPVEPHTAIIAFRKGDRIDDGREWPSHDLNPLPGYSYVELHGEQVRFIVNGNNPTTQIPAELPRLTGGCPRLEKLREGYQPPAYTEAAAVVLIPRGVASACEMVAENVRGRIDTRVTITNTDPYQVTACNKSITLRSNAGVSIINAPTAWVKWIKGTVAAESSGPHHSDAYRAMARDRTAAETGQKCELKRAGAVPICPSLMTFDPTHIVNSPVAAVAAAAAPNPAPHVGSPMAAAAPAHHAGSPMVAAAPIGPGQPTDPGLPGDIPPKLMATFECSNTQWP